MRSACLLAALIAGAAGPAAAGNEVMIDKCSKEVAFPYDYNGRPDSNNVVLLKRGSNGKTKWSDPFRVKLGPDGHIRWWCHSTTGNWADVGTWRITEIGAGTKCSNWADGQVEGCKPDASLKLGSSAWKDWTPERSRCGNRTRTIRAMLDGGRKLRIECLPKE